MKYYLTIRAYEKESSTKEAQTGKEKQITMEFKNEGLPSIFKRFEKVSGYKVLFIYDEISSYTSTGKVEKATVDEALKVIIGKNPLKYHIDGQFINITKEDSKKFFSQVLGLSRTIMVIFSFLMFRKIVGLEYRM